MNHKIAIIMGSDSDDNIMHEAALMLKQFNIDYFKRVVSAHRTPMDLEAFAKEAEANNVSAIIAGAGGAAHLPGMMAAFTYLPVIGVPIASKSLGGIDSLLSIVQMPKGVPVATMAINGAANAALFAMRFLASHDEKLRHHLIDYIRTQADHSRAKNDRLL